jgi:hypothetical protein
VSRKINAGALQDQSTFDTGRLSDAQAKRSIQGRTGRLYGIVDANL